MDSNRFKEWMHSKQACVELTLEQTLPALTIHSSDTSDYITDAMRYATLDGGKRIRPLLVYAAGELTQAHKQTLDYLAAALEMIHSYSLVHDDMPAMDNDDLRRGKPTCHKAYGEATALLAGDGLQAKAFELLSVPLVHLEPKQQIRIIQVIAKAAGHYGMVGGQAIDLANVGLPMTQQQLETMHCLKTGALIEASILSGAMAGLTWVESYKQPLLTFSHAMGLAFQVVDDILDCEADAKTLGKTPGKDQANNKPTYVSLMGLPKAKTYAKSLHQTALNALEPFGETAVHLRALAAYIIERSY